LGVGFEDFSLGSACARAGRVPVALGEPAPLSASYGYHIDAAAYSELVKQFALKLGIERVASGTVDVEVEGEQIAAVVLDDGSRLEADLYIDASGREGRLIGKMAGAEFESWSGSLPCDRLLAASGPRLPALPAFSQVSAFHAGWVALFPLQHRTPLVAAYSSEAVDDHEVAELAALVARMPIAGDVVVSDLKPGIQKHPWIGNCVAVGEAAIAADPIDALELHVAHGCIAHLITLFPTTAGEFPEADPFNRSIATFGSNLRDFQAAHSKLNRRFDEPFWDRARDAAGVPGLARRIDVFEARAAIPLNDEESFQEQTWAALFLGCGLMPKDYDPRIDSMDDGVHIAKVQQRLRAVADMARGMPPIEQFLAAEQFNPAEGVG
jgi:tryptophan halogenase